MVEKAGSEPSGMLCEVINGLQQPQKSLSSKFFYDKKGSELFQEITYLDEYYPTRTERKILGDNIDEITSLVGSNAMIVELGSGSSKKTRILLEELDSPGVYIPIDISEEYLLTVVNNLRMEYPQITIIPVFEDYTSQFRLPDLKGVYNQQVVFYPGSTIGNFKPDEARSFMGMVADITDPDASMLVGVDLKKDRDILEAAYNDSEGLTAKFNKNILRRINRELDANFDLEAFAHKAFYNEKEGRIEMHLVSEKKQTVIIDDTRIGFEKGETIHTENSYKYTLDEFRDLVNEYYSVEKVWMDERNYFSIQYLEKK